VPVPQIPTISNVVYQGSAGGINGYVSQGGDFTYLGNVGGITEIIISRGVNFDPTNTQNRVLRSVTLSGSQTLHWDGLDNSGAAFPPGTGFQYKITLHAGEYHFPLLDVENSAGGPSLTLLNPPGGTCPLASCSTAFYDHRGYRTSAGTVGTVNTTLAGTTPPSPSYSDTILGYNSLTQLRPFGNGTGTGFGNFKGLDLWSFFPSSQVTSTLNVVAATAGRDLAIDNLSSGYFEIGSAAVYTLRVSNMSSVDMTSRLVTVTLPVPAGLTYTSASGTGWACSLVSSVVTCTRTSALAAGASFPDISVTMQVTATVAPQVSTTATVAVTGDTVAANNTSSNTVSVRQYDYGDLPNTYNMTTLGQNGARNSVGSLYLGSLVAAKNSPTPDAEANSDAQDDGISPDFTNPWAPGNTVYVDVEVTGDTGYLVGWFDWGGDGTFNQPEDQVVFGSLPAGTHHLPLTVPLNYTTGTTLYSRFRLYSGVQADPLPTGASLNGEVEDYKWRFSPTAVTLTTFSAQSESGPAWGVGLGFGLLLVVIAAGIFFKRR
jgi:uncharacterized repeat protein (TIGR01451 family)